MDILDLELLANIEELENIENIFNENPRKRIKLIDRQNPFECLDDTEFHKRYRLPKIIVLDFIKQVFIDQEEQDTERRGSRIPFYLRFLITLRFYASGCFEITIGDTLKVNQSTVSRILREVSKKICQLFPTYIKFDHQSIQDYKDDFYRIAQFPGVIGCIDGSHIAIKSPGGVNAELYRNRKGYFSLNIQAVCLSDHSFTNFVARWPGSTHDSRVFQNSLLYAQFLDNQYPQDTHLLGDMGYSNTDFILTPFRTPQTVHEEAYNVAHKKTRNRIECAFGIMKRRFPVVGTLLRTSLDTTLPLISSVAILHNLAISKKIQDAPVDAVVNPGPQLDGEDILAIEDNQPRNAKRDRIAATYF